MLQHIERVVTPKLIPGNCQILLTNNNNINNNNNNNNNSRRAVRLRIYVRYCRRAVVSVLLNTNLIYLAKIRRLRILMETDLPLSRKIQKDRYFFISNDTKSFMKSEHFVIQSFAKTGQCKLVIADVLPVTKSNL